MKKTNKIITKCKTINKIIFLFEHKVFLDISGLKNNFSQIPFSLKISIISTLFLANITGVILYLKSGIFLSAPLCNNFFIILLLLFFTA